MIEINTPPQVQEARDIVTRLETLEVGDVARFDPPIQLLVVHVLYMLLNEVDKGWRITPWMSAEGPREGGLCAWWARLKAAANQPVTMTGEAIPQTISEIQRTR